MNVLTRISLGLFFTASFLGHTLSYGQSNVLQSQRPTYQSLNTYPVLQIPDNLALSMDQLGIRGPLSATLSHSSLTGTYLEGQYARKVAENIAVGVLGELGSRQYRINATLGLLLFPKHLLKISGERFNQRLPFNFDSGPIETRVGQNAFGLQYEHAFENFPGNLSLGGYFADADNKSLTSQLFYSDGFNCPSAETGFLCLNQRRIAGGESRGVDVGLGSLINPDTYLKGKIYYDTLNYKTIYVSSTQDRQGLGGGIYGQQLLGKHFKLSANAELRKIYNTYNLGLSWLPPHAHSELSLMAQHVKSYNATPDNDIISLQWSLLSQTDKEPTYSLNPYSFMEDLEQWVRQPAVKMNQVLAIAEQITKAVSAYIYSISPNVGPLAGGNTVVITGNNFVANTVVRFGQQLATVINQSATSVSVLAPAANIPGAVDVTLTPPNNQTITLPNSYLYLNNNLIPTIFSINPNVGSVVGLNQVTILGENFVPGSTEIILIETARNLRSEQIVVIPDSVTSTSLVFTVPAHPVGPIDVIVKTPYGSSPQIVQGYTYIDGPTVQALEPNVGPSEGLATVTLTGTGFVEANTLVNFGEQIITPTSVNTNSLTFRVPAYAGQSTVGVSVTTPAGTSNVLAQGFTYIAQPTINNITPQTAPISGAGGIKITGSNFVPGNTTVQIDNQTVIPDSITSTEIIFTAPEHAAGTVTVTVVTPAGSSSPGQSFSYTQAPVINGINPAAAPITGQSGVVINGSGFVPGSTTVGLDSLSIQPSVVSATQIVFDAPPHAPGNVSLSVSTPLGSNTFNPGFNYTTGISVTSLTPNTVPTAGNVLVTVTGNGFIANATVVTVDGEAIDTNVESTTQLTFYAPAHDAGNVEIVVAVGSVTQTVNGGLNYVAAPTITNIAPQSGSTAGGSTVTVEGNNFAPNNTVVILDGTTITPIQVSQNSLTFNTLAHAPGTVSIAVKTPGGTSASGNFSFYSTPTVTAVNPAYSNINGASGITITGDNFIPGDTVVYLDNTAITPQSVTATSIVFNAPAHAAGQVTLYVKTSVGDSAYVSGGFTYLNAPTVTTVNPNVVSVNGQTGIIISGSGFTADTVINFAGAIITPTAVNSTSITFDAPAHAVGGVDISVTTPIGTSNVLSPGLSYIAGPTANNLSPNLIPLSGATVTLTGSGFVAANGATTVIVNGQSVTPTSITANSLTFIAPASNNPGTVNVSVTTAAGNSNNVTNGLTYVAAPSINSLNPTSGSTGGNTQVTIAGNNFIANNTNVLVDNVAVTPTNVTPTSLTFITPSHNPGSINVAVSTPGGISANSQFTYISAPVITSASPSFANVNGTTDITLTGNNFTAGTQVILDGVNLIPDTVNATQIVFKAPAHRAGNVTLTVTTSSGSGNLTGGITYAEAPNATSLSPNVAALNSQTLVTVTGSGFIPGYTQVNFNNTVITPNTVTDNSLTFTAPANTIAGIAQVSVTTPIGTSANVNRGFIYVNAPTINSLTPTIINISGGVSVTITGTNFIAGGTKVLLDTNEITPSLVTANSLTFTAPAHAAGTVEVSVVTQGGSSNIIANGITYVTTPTFVSISPDNGSSNSTTSVTISGSGFIPSNTNIIWDNNQTITPDTVTATSITFTAPTHAAGKVAVVITTPGGSVTVPNGFTYVAAPTISNLSIAIIPTAGQAGLTLVGSGFVQGNTTVDIDGVAYVPASVSANALVFDAPAHAAGNVTLTVTVNGVTSTALVGGLTYAALPVGLSLNPSAISLNGSTGIVINGNNFIPGQTTITIGNITVNPTSVTPTSLTFDAPAQVQGTVAVTITTPGGTSTAVAGGLVYLAPPSIISITPAAVSAAGGTVTITGSGFSVGNTTVTVNNTLVNVTVVNSTTLIFEAPPNPSGTAVAINVSTPGGTSATVNNGLTYADLPVLTTLTPNQISVNGMSNLVLSGTGFVNGATTVTIDGNVITPTIITATSLMFDAPAHAAGVVNVTVTTPIGTSANLSSGLTYLALPVINSVNPSTVSVNGLTNVMINGDNFVTGETTITLDGQTITPTSINANQLIFDAPAHTAGTATLNVTTVAGTSANLAGGLTYVDSPVVIGLTPAFVPTSGGIAITLTGSGFVAGETVVTINGVIVTPTFVSSTMIVFTAPANPTGNVPVEVTTPGGNAQVFGGLNYYDAPTVNTLTPNAISINGQTNLTISGTNFIVGNTTITLDGNTINPTAVTATSLTFDAPAHASGTVNVSVTTPIGTSASITGGLTYADLPTISTVTPQVTALSGGATITLNGSNFIVGNTQVQIDNASITPTVNSSSVLTFTAPAHAAGGATVTITTPIGNSAALTNGLTYIGLPVISSITPNGAPLAGLANISISGQNFVAGSTTVSLDGNMITPKAVTNNTLSFDAPAHAAGTVNVSVTTPVGTSNTNNFTYLVAPTVSAITPSFVSINGNTSVSITGTGFIAGSTEIMVGTTEVTPISVSANSLTFIAPAQSAGNQSVTVTTPAGSAAVTGGLTFADNPTVGALSPVGGSIGGQANITLTGANFIPGNTQVNLDNLSITPNSVTANSVVFNAPAHAAGLVNVSVTTPIGTSANVNGGFTYATNPTAGSISSTVIPLNGLNNISLTGTNFIPGSTVVNVGSSVVTPTNVTSTSVIFNAPAHAAGTVDVSVTTNVGTSANISGGLTYLDSPIITSINPNKGGLNGTSGVILNGNNFLAGYTTVNFGGTTIVPTSVNSTSLTFDAPAHAAGTVSVTASTPVGTSNTLSGGFTYSAVPNITSCSYPGGALSTAWLCVGTNMNVFPNTYLNIRGGLTCSIGLGVSLLTTTIKNTLNLGSNSLLPNMYAGCSISLCDNSTCTGLQSNVAAFN